MTTAREYEQAVREWEHGRWFKPADPDCDWCGGWGEVGDEFNPANCSCVEKTREEREEYEATTPKPVR